VTQTVQDERSPSQPRAAETSYVWPYGGAGGVPGEDKQHWLEKLLGHYPVRKLLAYLAKGRPQGDTIIERILYSYHNPQESAWNRLKYWPIHKMIDRIRGGATIESFHQRIAEHRPTVRGIVATMRSVAELGLSQPQRWVMPLFAVWNFTQKCNLRCRHCYQSATPDRQADELNLDEKIRLIDELASHYMAMIAFAGGEPTLSKDLLPVLKRCQHHGMHTSIATHGGTMTPQLAGDLAEAGVRYVEISLDSVHPDKHDAFRGVPGMWQRTVQGMKNVVAEPRLRLGVAMCVHRDNVDEVEQMLQFCETIGAGSFAHFNFIPVGRGKGMIRQDLTPRQRQELLELLQRWMQKGTLGVISTAPQLGRVCLTHAPIDGKVTCSHAGSGSGFKARVVARYLGGCGAGRTYMCIQPNGDVTPCVYLPHRVMGNVRQKPVKDIWLHSETWEVLNDRDRRYGGCATCKYKSYCGGCRARADAYYGDLMGPDPGCVFNQSDWDKIVEKEASLQVCGPCDGCQPAAAQAAGQ
jgi:radical SAM protein with 4Fe4S-binding SPASM domain